jgi:hypothetical protein
MQLEEIKDRNGMVLATLISSLQELAPGHTFPTSPDDELQLGLFNHPKDHVIKRHYHPPFDRELKFTNEVLIIMSGLVQVDIYDDSQELITSRQLGSNSVVILRKGGHGFSIIEHAVILEVKQGPYAGNADKILF